MAGGSIAVSSNNQYISGRIDWSSSPNAATNTSTVSVWLYLRRTNTGHTTSGNGTFTVTVNGTNISNTTGFTLSYGKDTLLVANSVSVPHNADGTKSIVISCSCSISSDISLKSIAGSQTVTLDRIPRASSFSLNRTSIDAGDSIQATIHPAYAGFSHKITWRFANASSSSTLAAGTNIHAFSIPMNWLEQLPSSTSGTATCTVDTMQGSVNIGSVSKTFTIKVPSNVIPSIGSVMLERIDGDVPADWGIYVQGKSKVKVSILNSQGIYGSTIRSYSISGGGYSVSSNTLTSGFLNEAGTIRFTCTVTDTRGRSAIKEEQVNVVPYAPPTYVQPIAYRCGSDGVALDTGTYACVRCDYTFSPCGGLNAVNGSVTHKVTTSDTWNQPQGIEKNAQKIIGDGSLMETNSYDIRFALTDAFTTAYWKTSIPTAAYTMHFRAGGKGVAVGKASEYDEKFDVAWDTNVDGDLIVGGALYVSGPNGQVLIGPAVGENLLINSDFRINQRGKTSYSASGYTVDRWQYREISGNVVTPTSYGISTTSGVIQRIEGMKRYVGQTFTFSGELQNGTVQQVTGVLQTGTVPANDYMQFGMMADGENAYCTLKQGNWKWVKFERGSEATPFHPRSYADEICMCKRYYQIFDNAIYAPIIQYAGGYGYAYFTIDQMRTKPTLRYTSAQAYKSSDNSSLGAAGATAYSSNTIRASASGLGTGSFIMISSTGLSCDAEIY